MHDGHFSIFAFCPARHACNVASLSLCTSKTVQLRCLIQSVSIIALHRSEWDSVRIDWLTYAVYLSQHTPADSAYRGKLNGVWWHKMKSVQWNFAHLSSQSEITQSIGNQCGTSSNGKGNYIRIVLGRASTLSTAAHQSRKQMEELN